MTTSAASLQSAAATVIGQIETASRHVESVGQAIDAAVSGYAAVTARTQSQIRLTMQRIDQLTAGVLDICDEARSFLADDFGQLAAILATADPFASAETATEPALLGVAVSSAAPSAVREIEVHNGQIVALEIPSIAAPEDWTVDLSEPIEPTTNYLTEPEEVDEQPVDGPANDPLIGLGEPVGQAVPDAGPDHSVPTDPTDPGAQVEQEADEPDTALETWENEGGAVPPASEYEQVVTQAANAPTAPANGHAKKPSSSKPRAKRPPVDPRLVHVKCPKCGEEYDVPPEQVGAASCGGCLADKTKIVTLERVEGDPPKPTKKSRGRKSR